MSETFNPLDAGVFGRFVAGDHVDSGQWNRARAAGEIVGVCRVCGGYLKALGVYQVGRVEWYEARCIDCGHEITAPGGRVLRRSARFTEQPVEWRDSRIARLAAHERHGEPRSPQPVLDGEGGGFVDGGDALT